jgi:hypothetical protein
VDFSATLSKSASFGYLLKSKKNLAETVEILRKFDTKILSVAESSIQNQATYSILPHDVLAGIARRQRSITKVKRGSSGIHLDREQAMRSWNALKCAGPPLRKHFGTKETITPSNFMDYAFTSKEYLEKCLTIIDNAKTKSAFAFDDVFSKSMKIRILKQHQRNCSYYSKICASQRVLIEDFVSRYGNDPYRIDRQLLYSLQLKTLIPTMDILVNFIINNYKRGNYVPDVSRDGNVEYEPFIHVSSRTFPDSSPYQMNLWM